MVWLPEGFYDLNWFKYVWHFDTHLLTSDIIVGGSQGIAEPQASFIACRPKTRWLNMIKTSETILFAGDPTCEPH